MLRRFTCTLPVLGIVIAIILYLHAASLYSAATSNDPARGGYHHFGNYWCELYNDVTYTGQPQAGRPYAIASTLAIVIALFFFWFTVSTLFIERIRLSRIARWSGATAAAIATLIFTPLHDVVITVAAPLGFIAVLAVCLGLALERHWLLLSLGIAGVTVGLYDYFIWKFKLLHSYQPPIQKSAFILIFLWVLATAIRVLMMPPDGVGSLATGDVTRE